MNNEELFEKFFNESMSETIVGKITFKEAITDQYRLELYSKWKHGFLKACEIKDKEISELKAKNKKLLKCVEFYADHNSWQLGECVIETCDQEEYQGGKLARLTLKEIEEIK